MGYAGIFQGGEDWRSGACIKAARWWAIIVVPVAVASLFLTSTGWLSESQRSLAELLAYVERGHATQDRGDPSIRRGVPTALRSDEGDIPHSPAPVPSQRAGRTGTSALVETSFPMDRSEPSGPFDTSLGTT